MHAKSSGRAGTWLLPALLALGCADPGGPVGRRMLPADYRGPDVREFFVEGVSNVVVEPSYLGEAERRARALELVGYKHIVIEWYLFQRIADRLGPDREILEGGLHAHVRNGATEDLALTELEDGRFAFRFRAEISAPLELFDLFPGDEPDPDAGLADAAPDGTAPPDADRRLLRLQLPVLDNETMAELEPGHEWYRGLLYAWFDPATYEGEIETIDLTLTPETRSLDGYIDYDRLIADGRLTVGVHVGWDYYPERYDRRHAIQVYDWLIRQGFHSPAASFDDYMLDSGPLTRTAEIDGRTVEVEVTLVHPLQGDAADFRFARRLKDALLESFREREVVIYVGHSGNHSGFLLANWYAVDPESGALMDYELPSIEMSHDYQIVLADGCQTYSMGESFYANPAKADHANLDLVATTNYSVTPDGGAHAIRLLEALVGRDGRPPRGTSYDELLAAYRPLETYMGLYGVHGIEDNPRGNPLADPTRFCAPCATDEDCGEAGSACLRVGRARACLPECLADEGCPAGSTCREYESRAEWGRPHGYCTPADRVCEWTAPDAGSEPVEDAAAETAPEADRDAPPDPPPDAGADAPPDELPRDAGCGCRAAAARPLGPAPPLLLLAALLLLRCARRTGPPISLPGTPRRRPRTAGASSPPRASSPDATAPRSGTGATDLRTPRSPRPAPRPPNAGRAPAS